MSGRSRTPDAYSPSRDAPVEAQPLGARALRPAPLARARLSLRRRLRRRVASLRATSGAEGALERAGSGERPPPPL
eukprot:CAMPEP_0183353260 /NCGR_PEP_ID=MMETSP0164_2-20130417/33157_1 /TAXON_ID=221442 /ORGANISM="Coccolithus pelagicus ssp braarudi, Strain PLY182g" /LENGTH=75 /DNA_ID=CAMNT_0025525911 /DNA_START=183 /DNA_END=406 /DNA_ORIENTATION=-